MMSESQLDQIISLIKETASEPDTGTFQYFPGM